MPRMNDKLLDAVTVTGAGSAKGSISDLQTFQAIVTGSGAVTASVDIQGSLDGGTNWVTIATITLNGTNAASDGVTVSSAWLAFRANCTALTGTSKSLTVYMAHQA